MQNKISKVEKQILLYMTNECNLNINVTVQNLIHWNHTLEEGEIIEAMRKLSESGFTFDVPNNMIRFTAKGYSECHKKWGKQMALKRSFKKIYRNHLSKIFYAILTALFALIVGLIIK